MIVWEWWLIMVNDEWWLILESVWAKDPSEKPASICIFISCVIIPSFSSFSSSWSSLIFSLALSLSVFVSLSLFSVFPSYLFFFSLLCSCLNCILARRQRIRKSKSSKTKKFFEFLTLDPWEVTTHGRPQLRAVTVCRFATVERPKLGRERDVRADDMNVLRFARSKFKNSANGAKKYARCAWRKIRFLLSPENVKNLKNSRVSTSNMAPPNNTPRSDHFRWKMIYSFFLSNVLQIDLAAVSLYPMTPFLFIGCGPHVTYIDDKRHSLFGWQHTHYTCIHIRFNLHTFLNVVSISHNHCKTFSWRANHSTMLLLHRYVG